MSESRRPDTNPAKVYLKESMRKLNVKVDNASDDLALILELLRERGTRVFFCICTYAVALLYFLSIIECDNSKVLRGKRVLVLMNQISWEISRTLLFLTILRSLT